MHINNKYVYGAFLRLFLFIHVYLTLDTVCLLVPFQFARPATEQSLNNETGGALVSGETPPPQN